MASILTYFFNPYDRKARLQPALLTLLPIFAVVLLLIPQFGAVWATMGGLLLYCGGTTLLTQVGRDRGKRLEPLLFQSWGGKPSVAMLRYRDTRLSQSTKERYRAFLERNVQGLTLASREDERTYPDQADDGYEGANSWLLAQTRNRQRFDLIFRENINYGFRRNIWALKPWALAGSTIAIGLVVALETATWTGELVTTIQDIEIVVWASTLLTIIHFLFFAIVIRRSWVRVPGEAYAQQLLAACDMLDDNQRP